MVWTALSTAECELDLISPIRVEGEIQTASPWVPSLSVGCYLPFPRRVPYIVQVMLLGGQSRWEDAFPK